MIVFERLKHMLIKEFIQIFRDPRMKAVIFMVPIIQVIIFGYAVSMDVRHIPTALFDLDNTPSSRELAAQFEGSGYFDLVQRVRNETESRDVIDSGKAKAVLRLNRGFSEAITGGRTASVQLLLDGSDSNTTSIIMGYAGRIAADYNNRVLTSRISRTTGGRFDAEPETIASRAWFNGCS